MQGRTELSDLKKIRSQAGIHNGFRHLNKCRQNNDKITNSVKTHYTNNQHYRLGDMFRFIEPSSGQFLKHSNDTFRGLHITVF